MNYSVSRFRRCYKCCRGPDLLVQQGGFLAAADELGVQAILVCSCAIGLPLQLQSILHAAGFRLWCPASAPASVHNTDLNSCLCFSLPPWPCLTSPKLWGQRCCKYDLQARCGVAAAELVHVAAATPPHKRKAACRTA